MPRVLIIDDDEQIRSILRSLLEGEGHEVMDAPDGEAGIALYRKAPADLVITDIYMPGKEGIETIRDLLRDFPGVRIIAMSGGAKDWDLDLLPAAKALGTVATIPKPFGAKDVLEVVRKSLAA